MAERPEVGNEYTKLMCEFLSCSPEELEKARRYLANECGDPEPDYPDGDDG